LHESLNRTLAEDAAEAQSGNLATSLRRLRTMHARPSRPARCA